MPEKQLPSRPSLEQYKKQAKDLLHQSKTSVPEAVQRFRKSLPPQKLSRGKFSLTDAQLVIAREHGFESWPRFTRAIESLRYQSSAEAQSNPVTAFIEAASVPKVGAHVAGTLDLAQTILAEHPEVAADSIYTAAILGEEALVRRFVERDPASATRKGGPYDWDALTYLCFSRYLRLDKSRSEGFLRTAQTLLDAGANPNTGWFENDHQPKPAWESVLYGAAGVAQNADLTRLLLERGGDPNDDETPYHVPESYDLSVLRVMLESGKLTPDNLATILLRKNDWHDLEGVKLMLANGADPDRMTRWGYTGLHQSLRRDNSLEIVQAMLDHGADPHLRNLQNNQSGISMAARRGRSDVLLAMQQRGISIELQGVERLIAACAMNDEESIRAQVKDDPAPVQQLREQGGTLLSEFAGNGNTDGVRHLLDLGVDVAARYKEGDPYYDIARDSTALHVAAWRSRPATVRLLIERGAPIDLPDGKGPTPLALAVRACVDSYWTDRRTPESVVALLHAGASARNVEYPSGYAEVDEVLRQFGGS
jgi:ankyrin repeat protein